jgi:UDP-N-acetylmuramoyl-tripeptide--D-alanyl-D-alanine ligase
MSWQEILEGLSQGYTQLRLVAVRSESGALILDDTYNAAPESMMAALNLLDELDGRKIAVLGDMLELGPYERQGHEMVGMRAAQVAQDHPRGRAGPAPHQNGNAHHGRGAVHPACAVIDGLA